MSAMLPNATLVPLADVLALYQLDRHIYSIEGLDEGDVYLVSDSVLMQEDLDLSPVDADVLGIIVDGDLEIDGDLLGLDEDALFLFVTGGVTARMLWNDGAEIVVGGSLELEHGLIGDSENGYVHVEGDLITPYMVVNEHEVAVSGDNQAVTIDLEGGADDCEYELSDLMEEVLDEDGEPDLALIQQRLREGEPLLK